MTRLANSSQLPNRLTSLAFFSQDAFERCWICRARGIARFDAGEAGGFLVPLLAQRQTPGSVAQVRDIPADRFDFDVHHLVMGSEQLQSVSVGIAEIGV